VVNQIIRKGAELKSEDPASPPKVMLYRILGLHFPELRGKLLTFAANWAAFQ
jgi:hypothetical protein